MLDDVSLRVEPGRGRRARRRERLGQDHARQADLPALPAAEGRILWNGARRARRWRPRRPRRHDGHLPGLRPVPPERARQHRARPGRARARAAEAIATPRAQAGAARLHRAACRTATTRGSGASSTAATSSRSASGSASRSPARSSAAASFLVLDEPTASLDPRAEHELFEQMRGARRRRVGAAGLAPLLERAHRRPDLRARGRPSHRGRRPRGAHGAGGHYAELFRLQAAAVLGGYPAATG